MTESLLNKLFPGRFFDDKEAEALIDYAISKMPAEWNAAQFMYERGQVQLAADYLQSLTDHKLRRLGIILPELLRKSAEETPKTQVNNYFQKEVTCNGGTVGGNIDSPIYKFTAEEKVPSKEEVRLMLENLVKNVTFDTPQWYAVKQFLVQECKAPADSVNYLRYLASLDLHITYPLNEENYRHVPSMYPRLARPVSTWDKIADPSPAEKKHIAVVHHLYTLKSQL